METFSIIPLLINHKNIRKDLYIGVRRVMVNGLPAPADISNCTISLRKKKGVHNRQYSVNGDKLDRQSYWHPIWKPAFPQMERVRENELLVLKLGVRYNINREGLYDYYPVLLESNDEKIAEFILRNVDSGYYVNNDGYQFDKHIKVCDILRHGTLGIALFNGDNVVSNYAKFHVCKKTKTSNDYTIYT